MQGQSTGGASWLLGGQGHEAGGWASPPEPPTSGHPGQLPEHLHAFTLSSWIIAKVRVHPFFTRVLVKLDEWSEGESEPQATCTLCLGTRVAGGLFAVGVVCT